VRTPLACSPPAIRNPKGPTTVTETTKARLLKIILRTWALGSIAIFTFIFIGYAMHANVFRPGAAWHWAVWDDLPGHVAMMLAAIYLTWSVFLLLAARKPGEYASFLDFTMWANLVHGLVMVPGGFEHGYHGKFLTDIPWILLLSVAIYFLRPESSRPGTQVGDEGLRVGPGR
jgi:hypothetical protein